MRLYRYPYKSLRDHTFTACYGWLQARNIGPGDVTVVTGCEELRGAAKVDVKEDVMDFTDLVIITQL